MSRRRAYIGATLPWNSPHAIQTYVQARYKTGGGSWNGSGGYTLVHDPTPISEGGYRPGAEFSREEVRLTLRLEHYSIGTRLENGKGEVYEVAPKSKGGGLCLKAVKT